MIEKIDSKLCNGCGWCELACPMELILLRDISKDDKKKKQAYFNNPMECVVCYNCEKVCPKGAITVGSEKPIPHP
jgi:2-oxoglutarate ferredoxin oxidoreductase subunit delta